MLHLLHFGFYDDDAFGDCTDKLGGASPAGDARDPVGGMSALPPITDVGRRIQHLAVGL
jgi:hypothetical protein